MYAAGVNFNNVWVARQAGLGLGYGDHPEYGHHIGGSDASGIVWKVGPGVTNWQPGDEVVIHCNQASYEDVEVHGLDPMAAPSSQKIRGYETTWGSFAQFTKGGAAASPEAAEPLLGRLLGLRPHLLHGVPDADEQGADPGRPQRPYLGRGGRPRRLRRAALQGRCRAPTASASSLPTRRASWSSSSARSTTSTATSSRT